MLKDKYELSKAASELRDRLGEDNRSPVDVFRLAHAIEPLTLVFYPMGERISGMCLKGTADVLIAVNRIPGYKARARRKPRSCLISRATKKHADALIIIPNGAVTPPIPSIPSCRILTVQR
jgi:hypothetical protein